MVEVNPVYFHDCPALGKHTKLPRAFLTKDKAGQVPLGYQYKCPFCSQTAGEFVPYEAVDVQPSGEVRRNDKPNESYDKVAPKTKDGRDA